MVDILKNIYWVGPNQPYSTANQAVTEIANALAGGDYELPSTDLPDGGQINIVFRYGGLHPPLTIPNDTTGDLADSGRFLIIKMEASFEAGGDDGLVADGMVPTISINAPGVSELAQEDKFIGLDIGSNNPNIKLQNLRVEGFIMGVRIGPNCHNFYMNGCFIVNNLNCQVFMRDLEGAYITNNLIIGGEYGLVVKFVKNIRAYHNTIFLDGVATLTNSGPKAGAIIQGERHFGGTLPSIFFLGNLVFTIGCPSVIFYDEDTKNNRLITNYNDFFTVGQPLVQLRQDSATLENEEEVILQNFYSIAAWSTHEQLGDLVDEFMHPKGLDADSTSIHPVFIANIQNSSYGDVSIIDLTSINNSPILEKVPSWFDSVDLNYIPPDFDETIIAIDSLLNTRESPFTSIGANDAPSANGFFGSDIFTSPLVNNINKICDVDPLVGLTKQNIEMAYPSILAGYFYSNEREYYLYSKKGAYQLGFLARSTFALPGFLSPDKKTTITSRGYEINEEDWDLVNRDIIIYHRKNGIVSNSDEVTIEGWIREWPDLPNTNGFVYQRAYYSFKICDGELDFILPDNFVSNAPVVVTDDRVSYRDPLPLCRRNFSIIFDKERQESKLEFLGNKNLIENPQFNVSTNGLYPQGWDTDEGRAVFLAGENFSYIGEQCVAMSTSTVFQGRITSNKIPIISGSPISFSWHAATPRGIITGGFNPRPLDNISVLSGEYVYKLYNNHENLVETLTGEFVAKDEGYSRYYINFGPDQSIVPENPVDPDEVGITGLNNLPYDIPSNVDSIELTLQAKSAVGFTGSILIDGCQAEYNIIPTTYHQEPSYEHMTVEFETSDTNIFVDKRMNLSPYFNQNPNGFLYISDIPAKVWGGPEDLEVTSLHEYRWPEGRIYHLPWARTHGKDKMSYRAHDAEEPMEPYGLIEPFSMPRRAAESFMIPSTLETVQDDLLPEGIMLQVLDDVENPYSLRSYTITALDVNGNFPGYLSKTKFGAKEQLGTTLFGQLNENGAANVFYVPPSRETVRYIGTVPDPETSTASGNGPTIDDISYIKTRYNCNLINNGNITILGQSGEFHATAGSTIVNGSYYPTNGNDFSYVPLQYPPVFGSVQAIYSGEHFTETIEVRASDQFSVDYVNAQIIFFSDIDRELPITIKYLPKYVYPAPEEPNKIIFHHEYVFGSYTGPIQVDYDAELFIEITAQQPVSGEHTNTFPVIAQNPQLSVVTNSSLSLEF
jgi:hypothetical protein